MNAFEDPDDIYPLSPMQQGMLFQTLQMPGSGVCFEQDIYLLRGSLDARLFRQAWETVVALQPVLRTSFLWEDLEEPHQIVHKQGVTDLREEDWRALSEDRQRSRLAAYLGAERDRGFSLTTLPLMRLALFRLAENSYQLVWNFHHAILDGWSLPLVIQDVLAVCHGLERGVQAALPARLPYRDFIGWHLSQDTARAEVYWRGRLAGFTEKTPLTVMRHKPDAAPVTGQTFQSVFHQVPRSITGALTDFSRTYHVTLGTLVQGAWALLLGRCAGTEEVVFGCNLAGRPPELPGIDSMVGCLINTLPMRVPTAPGAALLPWLKAIQHQLIETLEVHFSPLVQIQRWSQIPAGQSLFDTIVVIENYPMFGNAPDRGGLEVLYQSWTKQSRTGYPLTLLALPGEELLLEIKFDSRLFDAPLIAQMLCHLETLLAGMAEAPHRPIEELPWLGKEERAGLIRSAKLVADSAGTVLPSDGGRTLHRLFETQAARRPGSIALTCDGQTLTYAQLNAQANRLARELTRRGVRPDTLVGLCMERSGELIVAILAILKAGGAYLPIDLAYPAERLAFILDDAQAPLLLTQRKLTGNLPATQASILCIEELFARPASPEDETNLPAEAEPDHLAYCIYTSGTTGQPKGSLIAHRNTVRLFAATEHLYHFGEHDTWTLFHSCAFDFSVWEIWGALLYGGRLVVVPFLVSRSPEAFRDLLARERVTVLNQTPSAFRQFVQAEEMSGAKDLALRYVIFGGEALEMQSLRPWFERHGDRQPMLVNMYGITETTVHVTYRALSKDDLDSGSVIGTPLADLQIYILDPRGEPVPAGVPGEMYVGGAGLARGYLRRPELTAERFVPDHLTGEPGARLYRTGDLARFLPDRDIEYLGRIDQQVKIRGFRIEPGEIESVLCRHDAVREAVVLAREDTPGAKRLVAWLVTTKPAPEQNALREHLKRRLPDYMVPAAFVFLDQLPLTNNGKIDRKALPAPEEQRPELAARYLAPRTPAEEILAKIWSKVLRAGEVGVHDNFFELGGDSILSIQILSLARREGLRLTPALLFAHPTIAELATVAGIAEEAQDNPEPGGGDIPPTPIQHWFFAQDLVDPNHYNQACLLEVREPLDPLLLEQALQQLSLHHDALRLRCVRQTAAWRLYNAPPGEAVPLSRVSLAALGESEQRLRLEEAVHSAQADLCLAEGPVWRAVLFEMGPGLPDRLLLAIHHLAIDGVSWRPLLEDLETACRCLQAGEPVGLPPRTASFQKWATRLTELAAGGALRAELPWWQDVTAPAHTAALVNLLPDPAEASNTEANAIACRLSLTAAETQALLQQVPAAYNTQVNDLLLTALARAWSVWSGGRALYTHLEGHGREDLFPDVDLSRTVGWFTSLFPVRLETPGTAETWSPGAALQAVKEQLRRIPQRGVGYGILRYLSGVPELRDRPEPRMVFNYLGQFDQVLAGSELFRFAPESTGPWHSPSQRRHHALELNCMVIAGRLEFCWTWPRHGAIASLSDGFLNALRELIAHCLQPGAGGRTPSDFPLAHLDQPALDRLVGARRDIEDILPLSPIQTLFLSAAPASGAAAFDQWHCTFEGDLDVTAFERAWRETLRRHAILRTTIHGEALNEPVQMVHRDPPPVWRIEDWRDSPSSPHAGSWSDFLRQDRSRPLPMTEAPLLRFALVRVADRTWKFLWSVPALLLDGWSWPVVFRDVSQFYESLTKSAAPVLEPVRPYRDYIEWLGRQSGTDARRFWKDALAGFAQPTPLPGETPVRDDQGADGRGERYARHMVQLPEEATRDLQAVARRLRITPGAILQAAWAILLGRQTGHTDVVFGAAFAGRPADLPSVESIAGPFVNNLPVRVAVDANVTAGDFLRHVHARLLQLNAFQFTPLMEIQGCSEVPWRHRLFDSLVVFQNYVVDDAARRLGTTIGIAHFTGPIHTSYPVLLLAEPEAALRLTVIYDRQSVAGATAAGWACQVASLLTQLPVSLDRRLAGLEIPVPPPADGPVRPHPKRRAASRDYVPPRTDTERLIAGVWANLFDLENISVEENFFDLGAHSLLLVQAHSRLRDLLQTNLPIVALFEHPTIRSLARHLTGAPAAPETGQQWLDLAKRQKQAMARMRVRQKT